MTICILKLEPGQSIPRPFSRACDKGELCYILGYYRGMKLFNNRIKAENFAENVAILEGSRSAIIQVVIAAIDTEEPVMDYDGTKFFAFTEE